MGQGTSEFPRLFPCALQPVCVGMSSLPHGGAGRWAVFSGHTNPRGVGVERKRSERMDAETVTLLLRLVSVRGGGGGWGGRGERSRFLPWCRREPDGAAG